MLVKRQEKDNKIKAMYSSATVCASTYNKDTKELTVIFNKGGQYQYPDVDIKDYTRLELAESTGSDFNTYIKTKYKTFKKLDDVNPVTLGAILKEIDELKASDDTAVLKAKTKIMLDAMTKVIGGYVTTDKINPTTLKLVENAIAEYNKAANPAPIAQLQS